MTRPAADADIKATPRYADVNAVGGGYLRDLAFAHALVSGDRRKIVNAPRRYARIAFAETERLMLESGVFWRGGPRHAAK